MEIGKEHEKQVIEPIVNPVPDKDRPQPQPEPRKVPAQPRKEPVKV